jgi:hypothetical protein
VLTNMRSSGPSVCRSSLAILITSSMNLVGISNLFRR